VIDAVTAEIVRNYLETVAAEVIQTMTRTSVSPIFNEAHDCSAGVFAYDDREVSLIARADAAPVHIYAALSSVEACLDFFQGNLAQGDVLLVCDPYDGGSHLPDYTVVMPVFIGGKPQFFPSVRGHMPDNGGPVPGGNLKARDIWQEGFRFSPIKLYERGELREDVWQWIVRNNRLPENLRADLEAMIGGCRIGELRIRELCDRYGIDVVLEAVRWILDSSERRMRERVSAWPDGEYSATSLLDTDFAGRRDLPIKVTLRVEGDEITADFSGSAAQSDGIANSVPANTLAFLYTAFSALCPEIPINSGFFRPVHPVLPPRTIVNAEEPAAVRANTVTPGADIGDVVMKAAEGFAPERVGTCTIDLLGPWLWGRDERSGRSFLHYELLCTPTASGGVDGADGWGAWPATFSSADVPSVEMSEVQYPVLYRSGQLVTDSAAPGRWRGSAGWATVRVPHHAADQHHSIRVQGLYSPLHGFCGGADASGNYVVLDPGGEQERVVSTWTDSELSPAGEAILLQSGGGGGWGNPLERDPELVRRDVLDELVSLAGARWDYGVVLDPDRLTVDLEATAAERLTLAAQRTAGKPWLPIGRRDVLERTGIAIPPSSGS
jgi:N-methylhydantoinase B